MIFVHWLAFENNDLTMRKFMGENVKDSLMEMHALSSASKPVCTWCARDGIQDCREACGGHGYLQGIK